MVTEDLYYESKTTNAKSYTLKRADLRTAEKQALAMDKVPVFLIEYGDGSEFIVLRRADFEEYHRLANEDN